LHIITHLHLILSLSSVHFYSPLSSGHTHLLR
jgi:hypothetical protein